ncbi:MAG: hypothetical protein WC626_08350 [Methanoregula sp.]
MINGQEYQSGCQTSPALKLITGFFLVIFGAAAVLALMILLLPDKFFLAISNYLQIIAAITGALVFLYFWYRCGNQETHLYVAGGLGLWGISNIAWYVNVLMGQRNMVFPSLIDIGMIASILIMSVAFQKGLPKKQIAPHILLGLLVICLIIPLEVIVINGISASTLITLLYFFACGSMIVIGLNHSLLAYPKILIGTLLFALTFMIYPLRELFFISNPVLPVIGTFVSAGFSLMVIGWLSIFESTKTR